MVPCLLAVGHLCPIDNPEVVLLSSKLMSTGCDSYDAISSDGKSRKIVKFERVGGMKTKTPSYSMKVSDPVTRISSYQQSLNDIMKYNAEKIENSKLVRITKAGSEYEGMAGTVDKSRISFHNTVIEFPVRIEMDNGLVTEVWMTDDDVDIYME
jgi:hypothetical protein